MLMRKIALLWFVIAVIVAATTAAFGTYLLRPSSTSPSADSTISHSSALSSTAAPTIPGVVAVLNHMNGGLGNDEYRVGPDIDGGVYQSLGPEHSGTPCTWVVLKDASGQPDAVVASGTSLGGPDTVRILSSDYSFRSSGCATWWPIGR